MAEPAGAGATTPILADLPDDIAIWEILIRLPPKPLLRCRAVCHAWRRATSAREFLLAHHGRQRCLPLLCGDGFRSGHSGSLDCLDIVTFDHQAASAQLQPVARLDDICLDVTASSSSATIPISRAYPSATRQLVSMLLSSCVVRSCPWECICTPPTGEYRLLLCLFLKMHGNLTPGYQNSFYVFALGSCEPPRQIASPEVEELRSNESVLVHGSLHWHHETLESQTVLLFDTTAESFRRMCVPVVLDFTHLFEMDGTLGMSSVNDESTIVDIWVMKDYEHEVWTFRCRVKLPVAEIRVQFGKYECLWDWHVEVMPHGELFLLVKNGDWLHKVDIDSKLVDSFHRKRLCLTEFRLKQTLVQHAFFPT